MDSTLYRLEDGTFALTLKAATAAGSANAQQRLPTHFILLIDTSDSMADSSKLANVKHSASLVLHFLGPQDRLSVVTFGDDATTHAKAVECTPDQKEALNAMFERIRTDGCTNLSAGLLAVRDMLARREPAVATLKTGILLLTDGHANRGVSRADMLRDMVRQIHDEYPDISLQAVGYGTDHNAELLKGVAEQTAGTYSIVDNREGAATVIGDTLGNLFSCVAQRVTVVPGRTHAEPEGTQFVVSGDPPRIQIGDLYEETETLMLFKVKNEDASLSITVRGTLLPSMAAYESELILDDAITEIPWSVKKAVDLTRCRYRISALFKDLREFRLGANRFAEVLTKVEAEETLLKAPHYHDDAVAKMLLAECASLREATAVLQRGSYHDVHDMTTRLVSHEAYTNLGRGTTQSIQRPPRGNSFSEEEAEDPTLTAASRNRRVRFPDPIGAGLTATTGAGGGAGLTATASQYMTSPYANRTARRVTQLMATMSAGGEEAAAAAHEAADLSQMATGEPHP
jgi:uncharacterized protein YegL